MTDAARRLDELPWLVGHVPAEIRDLLDTLLREPATWPVVYGWLRRLAGDHPADAVMPCTTGHHCDGTEHCQPLCGGAR